jgi:hypothetical protein
MAPPEAKELWHKICATCSHNLPRSAYSSDDRHKYAHCKACERKRLAEYRRKKKEKQAEEEAVSGSCVKRCRACLRFVLKSRFITAGMLNGIVCKPCGEKQKHHADPHKAVMVNGKCMLCEVYGPSAKCII